MCARSMWCPSVLVLVLVTLAAAITNQDVPARDSDSAEYTDLPQFLPFNQQLTQSLSPQQQSQILTDVQQHRFQLTPAQRHLHNLQSAQQFEPLPLPPSQEHPPPIEQSLGLGQQQYLRQQQQQFRQQQQQFSRPSQQPVYAQQPPSNRNQNLNLRNQFQQEYNRLLASQQFAGQLNNPTLNQEIPVFFPQHGDTLHQQPQQTYEFEPAPPSIPKKTSFKFEPAPEKTNYKFESNPQKPSYKFEAAPPKPTYKFEPAPESNPQKPSYKFEPAPPKPTYKFEPAPAKPSYKFEAAPTKSPPKYDQQPPFLPTQPTPRQTTYNYLKKKKAALTTTTTPATTTNNIANRFRYKFKTTTESPKPQVSIRPTQLFIKPDRQKLLQQLIESQQKQTTTTQAPKTKPKSNVLEFESEDELRRHIQQQLKDQGLLDEIKGTIPATNDQIDALPSLNFLSNANTSSPIYLPNGQNIKIIQVPSKIDPNTKKPTPQIKTIVINQPTTTTTTTTVKPPENLLKELTKGLPGDFEIIRQTQDGGLEELGHTPPQLPQKKVTFVILEEQEDGTLRVQGVRGNEKEGNGEEVESIIKKIEKGEIKLPKSTKVEHDHPPPYSNSLANATPEESVESPAYVKHSGKSITKHNTFQPTPASNYFESSTKPNFNYNYAATKTTTSEPFYQSSRTSSPTFSTNSFPNSHAGPVVSLSSNHQASSPAFHPTTPRSPPSAPAFLPTVPSDLGDNFYSTNSIVSTQRTTTYAPPAVSTTSQYSQVNVAPHNSFDDQQGFYKQVYQQNAYYQQDDLFSQSLADASANANQVYQPDVINQQVDSSFTTPDPLPIQQVVNLEVLPPSPPASPSASSSLPALVDIFRAQGLYAMSKFLRQSGLDVILNSTGPYTVFVPTDRAFRALLVQLGGPDKAEEKFQENPRLLSGLLLHHVIPGAFPLDTLQDEMTGVSLAGTQLRVNSYTMQDEQWNDVKVLTINGAVVMPDKKDMVIPQGVAHAVDRVMFPLPVGDIVQTLQSDRENRFGRFLQLIHETGLESMFTGSKILTVFAPVDSAFTDADMKRLEENRAQAHSLVLRHAISGTLYSAGMQYYQQRDSLDKGRQLTILKEAGRIKVNSANVISRNLPATNGVVHAIDSLL